MSLDHLHRLYQMLKSNPNKTPFVSHAGVSLRYTLMEQWPQVGSGLSAKQLPTIEVF